MTSPSTQRGLGLVEVMIAMVVLLIGAAGLIGLNTTSLRMQGDARRMTRATAIAQDLVNQIDTWSFDDARLVNRTTANDDAIGDPGLDYEHEEDPKTANAADYEEADLDLDGNPWNGIPAGELEGYQRFWNLAEPDDSNSNGAADVKRIAVIVRWPNGAGFRRVVLLGAKTNPAEGR
jgi:prepilin-type N-terminal cleavage/methylation domain-containing protein